MIFFAANDGTIIKSLPSPVYQGAANANTIYLIAPFAVNTQVTIAFKLPNGVWTEPALMTPQNAISETNGEIIDKASGKSYAGWSYAMPSELTRYYGTVTAQFFFYAPQAGVITATSSTSFTVGKGVPAVLPATPSQDVYEQILSNLSAMQEQLDNGEYPARSIYAWNSSKVYGANEYVFYPDYGELGAVVKSLVTENDIPPFTDGVLNSNEWELIADFNSLQKAIVTWGFNEAYTISELEWEVK